MEATILSDDPEPLNADLLQGDEAVGGFFLLIITRMRPI